MSRDNQVKLDRAMIVYWQLSPGQKRQALLHALALLADQREEVRGARP